MHSWLMLSLCTENQNEALADVWMIITWIMFVLNILTKVVVMKIKEWLTSTKTFKSLQDQPFTFISSSNQNVKNFLLLYGNLIKGDHHLPKPNCQAPILVPKANRRRSKRSSGISFHFVLGFGFSAFPCQKNHFLQDLCVNSLHTSI